MRESDAALRARIEELERVVVQKDARIRELETQLRLDPKTLALNGEAFRVELERIIRQPSPIPEGEDSEGLGTLLIYVDVRQFKGFNERFGQRGGDAALRHVVKLLFAAVRIDDVVGKRDVGRTGGDEFVAFFELITQDNARKLAGRLNQTFRSHKIDLAPRGMQTKVECHVEVHIGAVWWPRDVTPDPQEVIDIGDDLMWKSKDDRTLPYAWCTIAAP